MGKDSEEQGTDLRGGGEESGNQHAPTLEDLERTCSELRDRYIRLAADFDNYRKRSIKEREIAIDLANAKILEDLLVILDDFEMALPSLENEKNREGIKMLYKKLLKILQEHGLSGIECVGKQFDPNLHEAFCQEASSAESGTILEEYQKGYRIKSKVLRPSKVKIAENQESSGDKS